MNPQTKPLMYQPIFNPSICRLLFATCLSALCFIALSTQAATITVTNTNDSGAGSLRQAIANANHGDRIQFGITGTMILTTGELLVDKSVTISGPGAASLTVDGNGTGRVFHVSSGVTAAIAGLTITNGVDWTEAPLTNAGGGIYNDHATLALDNCTVSGNWAGWGSGIYNDHATLALDSCTVSGNTASWGGGGINNHSGTLTITNSTFSENWAAAPHSVGDGGAILNDAYDGNGTLTVTNSTFSGNRTYHLGGGIYNDGGATLAVNNSTFTDAPLTGSPAIDAGKNCAAVTSDQRGSGFVRTFDDSSIANANGGDGTDIGAFEVQGPPSQYAASIQQPINADGTSVFNSRRGVVPVKFTLTLGGVATCNLPPATIAVTRTAGGVIGPIDESEYNGSADNGSNFRIDSCDYVYNLSTGALGAGTYRVDSMINGQVVGSATFGLR